MELELKQKLRNISDLVEGVSLYFIERWNEEKKEIPIYIIEVHQNNLQICVYLLDGTGIKNQFSFDSSSYTDWHEFQNQLPSCHFILLRSQQEEQETIGDLFVPIQAKFLKNTIEFHTLVSKVLKWKKSFTQSLSFETQISVLNDIVMCTRKYFEKSCQNGFQLATTFHQIQSAEKVLAEISKKVRKERKVNLEEVENYPSSFRSLNEKQWEKLPSKIRDNLIEMKIFEESKMGGLQKSIIQVKVYDLETKKSSNKKRKSPERDLNINQLDLDSNELIKLNCCTKNHLTLLKDMIRERVQPGELNLDSDDPTKQLTLIVRQPRKVKSYSRFFWQKKIWKSLTDTQKDDVLKCFREVLK